MTFIIMGLCEYFFKLNYYNFFLINVKNDIEWAIINGQFHRDISKAYRYQ